jgi:hypothetical protein
LKTAKPLARCTCGARAAAQIVYRDYQLGALALDAVVFRTEQAQQ